MEYQLKLSEEKTISLYFGTWSLSRFCELNGNLSFSQMQEVAVKGLSYKDILLLLLCGAEHYAKKFKQAFDYTDVDAGDWLDEIGGLASEQGLELLGALGKAINPSYQGVEVVKEQKQKKSPKSVGSSLGSTVSEPA